ERRLGGAVVLDHRAAEHRLSGAQREERRDDGHGRARILRHQVEPDLGILADVVLGEGGTVDLAVEAGEQLGAGLGGKRAYVDDACRACWSVHRRSLPLVLVPAVYTTG